MKAELMRRVHAHEHALSNLIDMRKRLRCGCVGIEELEEVVAAEVATRNTLIEWEAPTASLAIEKLLHLLVHVLAAELAFDEASLVKIRAQVQGICNRDSPSQRE